MTPAVSLIELRMALDVADHGAYRAALRDDLLDADTWEREAQGLRDQITQLGEEPYPEGGW